ncbi:hypothetical protein [Fusobacterium sp.]|uniref:hypothetical protein n=1 Tax=Fusobacterium sp. TaxID=68766 RepID=UPI00263061C7|nr:hypothetical protein [Fusobacterium sp.]
MKNRGYLMLEGIIALGILTMIITISFSIFSNSMGIKEKSINYFSREVNYRKNIEYFLEEVKSGKNMFIDNNKLYYEIFIKENGEPKKIILNYYFSGNMFFRKASNSEKREVFLDEIKGDFKLKNNLLRINFIYRGQEEEYIIYVKEK